MKQTLLSFRLWILFLVASIGQSFTASADNVRIYYANPSNWSTVYAYVYVNDGAVKNASWPGVQMTYDATANVNGKTGWWVYDIPANLINGKIIFNNNGSDQFPGANQPGLDIEGKSKALAQNDASSWVAATTGGSTGGGGDTPTSDVYLYYYNSGNWSSVYVYVYTDGGVSNSAWPGVRMTYDATKTINSKTGWYNYQVPANLVNGYAIFTESSSADASHRYPADGAQGMSIGGKSHVFEGTTASSWSDNYDDKPIELANQLRVDKADGTYDLFTLTQMPQIRYNAGTVTISNASTGISEVSYSAADITSCTLVKDQTTGINSLSNEEATTLRSGNAFVLNGYKAGQVVSVYSISGNQVLAARIQANGSLMVDVSSLPKGVYILKTPSSSFKFVK